MRKSPAATNSSGVSFPSRSSELVDWETERERREAGGEKGGGGEGGGRGEGAERARFSARDGEHAKIFRLWR